MTFVQIIDCKTDKIDQMNQLMDVWIEQTKGKRTATHSLMARDMAREDHVVEIVEFPSYEEAMENSQLPETNRIFEEMVALCDEPPTFTDLDVVRDEQLNKHASRRFFEMASSRDGKDRLGEVLAEDYRDHDPANEHDIVGLNATREELEMYHHGFDFSFRVEDQIAEGDRVTTRWTWHGTHNGEFMGVPPTNREWVGTGMTIHRCRDGKIVEGWWNYDMLGLLRQLGIVRM